MPAEHAPDVDFVTADDGWRIATHTVGESTGAPALVLPGGPCRDPEYLGDLAGLGMDRSLVVLHPRGTTKTGGLSRGWWNDASDAIAVADALALDHFDIVAHSAGTRLALAVAAQFPGRARSLLLVTPATSLLAAGEYDGAEIAGRRTEPEVVAAMRSLEGPPSESESEFQRDLQLQAPAGYAAWTAVERSHAADGSRTLVAQTAWFTDIPGDAAERILAAERPPTLVLSGRDDILSGYRSTQAYAEALGAELVTIERCGHYPWVDQPAAFREAAARWLVSPVS